MTHAWKEKETIDVAFLAADNNGFRLVRGLHPYPEFHICLMTKGANEHGFANDIVLHTFTDWRDVMMFFAGWEKAMLAKAVAKTKPRKKS